MKGHQRSKSDMSFLKGQLQVPKSPTDVVDGANLSSSLPGPDMDLEQRIRNASRADRKYLLLHWSCHTILFYLALNGCWINWAYIVFSLDKHIVLA